MQMWENYERSETEIPASIDGTCPSQSSYLLSSKRQSDLPLPPPSAIFL